MLDSNKFLPISKEDLNERGIEQLDFVLVTGDAYIDHPSFAAAIIGRVLESQGYTVGIIAQPDWKMQTVLRSSENQDWLFSLIQGISILW